MTIPLAGESTLISDSDTPDAQEQPIVVSQYENSGGVGLMGADGATIYIPYRMVKEVCKVMTEYSKPKSSKKK